MCMTRCFASQDGCTPFLRAAATNNELMVVYFLEKGVDVNTSNTARTQRSLILRRCAQRFSFSHVSLAASDLSLHRPCVCADTSAFVPPQFGWTALVYAAANGYERLAEILLMSGALPHYRTKARADVMDPLSPSWECSVRGHAAALKGRPPCIGAGWEDGAVCRHRE